MGSSEKDNMVIIFAEAEVEGTSALRVGCSEWGNGEAKCGCEGLAELRDRVSEGIEGEELWATDRAGHLRLMKGNLNLREASLTEDTLDSTGSRHHIAKRERLAPHPDPHQEWTKWYILPCISKANRVNQCPLDAARVKPLVDVCTNLKPGICDRVVVDGSQLADVGLCFWTCPFRPGRA